VPKVPFYRPSADSPEVKYLLERRKVLGGPLPKRRVKSDETLTMPKLDKFKAHCESTGDREISTTMAFVRILSQLVKDKEFGKRIVPIVPDEARTFGMEGLFRQIGIYATFGQQYTPEDADQVMYYKEAENGQILEEGINEAGAFCSWMANTVLEAHNGHGHGNVVEADRKPATGGQPPSARLRGVAREYERARRTVPASGPSAIRV